MTSADTTPHDGHAADDVPTAPPTPPGTARRTPWVRAGIAVVIVLGVAAMAAMALREAQPVRLSERFPADYVGPVWLTLEGDDRSYEVRVEWGRLSRSFTHTGPEERTYFFDRGTAIYGRSGPLQVEVTPGTDVEFGFGPAPAGGIDVGGEPWDVAPIPTEDRVGPNRPASADDPLASAEVDETITYGLLVEGVGVRAAPDLEAETVTMVRHGDRLDARCWVEGQQMTNSNLQDPSDDAAAYTSRVWFLVDTPEGEGFIADAWFSRSADDGRLGLEECDGTPTG